jgi:hypothetical protein
MLTPFVIFRIVGWLFIILSIAGTFLSIGMIDKKREPITRSDVMVQIILTSWLIWFLYTAMQI